MEKSRKKGGKSSSSIGTKKVYDYDHGASSVMINDPFKCTVVY